MRRGFTLIEMLVVIVIIGILAAMISAAIVGAIRAGKSKATEATIRALEGAAERYKNEHMAYPPTLLTGIFPKLKLPNNTNNGIETLVAALSSKARGGPFYMPSEESTAFANADKDNVAMPAGYWYFGSGDLREYVDAWGQTMIYWNHNDYAKTTPSLMQVKIGGAEHSWKPPILESTKAYPNPYKFVIISPGPDGKPGTVDDLKNF